MNHVITCKIFKSKKIFKVFKFTFNILMEPKLLEFGHWKWFFNIFMIKYLHTYIATAL